MRTIPNMSTVDIPRSIGRENRVLKGGLHDGSPHRGSGEVAAVSTALIAWPPNWFRSAAATFAA